jgi:hypothetical protein
MTALIESVGLALEEPRQYKKSVPAKKPELEVGKRAPRTRSGTKKSAARTRRPPTTRRRG